MHVRGGCAYCETRAFMWCRFATLHREVIQRWGRFPHRNALLGRDTTPEEAAGMAEGTIPHF